MIYIFTAVLGYILFPFVWGLTNGVVVAPKIASNPSFQLELESILGKDEYRKLDVDNVRDLLANLHSLPDSKKDAITTLTRKYLVSINWLPVHLLANAISFGILGFTLGLFRAHKFCLIVPLVVLPVTLTALGDEQFVVVKGWLTIGIGLLTQTLVVFGSSIAGKWMRARLGIGPRDNDAQVS